MCVKKITVTLAAFALLVSACSISYQFNGASIDYTKVRSVSIKDFPNQAPLVYPPLSQLVTEKIKDLYIRQTRLQVVPANGDWDLEGEIIGYELAPMSVQEDAWAAQTRLTVTIRVRFTNSTNPEEDFEQNFSAYREFDASQMFDAALQDELCALIVTEIVEQIYNATAENW